MAVVEDVLPRRPIDLLLSGTSPSSANPVTTPTGFQPVLRRRARRRLQSPPMPWQQLVPVLIWAVRTAGLVGLISLIRDLTRRARLRRRVEDLAAIRDPLPAQAQPG